jgi:hypothetical protein
MTLDQNNMIFFCLEVTHYITRSFKKKKHLLCSHAERYPRAADLIVGSVVFVVSEQGGMRSP